MEKYLVWHSKLVVAVRIEQEGTRPDPKHLNQHGQPRPSDAKVGLEQHPSSWSAHANTLSQKAGDHRRRRMRQNLSTERIHTWLLSNSKSIIYARQTH